MISQNNSGKYKAYSQKEWAFCLIRIEPPDEPPTRRRMRNDFVVEAPGWCHEGLGSHQVKSLTELTISKKKEADFRLRTRI